jgi:hypothetical protein
MTIMRPPPPLHLDVVVRRVMADVAVDEPLAGLEGLPDDVVALARGDIDRIGHEARGGGEDLTVAGHDLAVEGEVVRLRWRSTWSCE